MSIDPLVDALPAAPPLPVLDGLPAANLLPPPLPAETTEDPFASFLHDFPALTIAASRTAIGGADAAVDAAKLAVPLLLDVENIVDTETQPPVGPLARFVRDSAQAAVTPPAPTVTADRSLLLRALLDR